MDLEDALRCPVCGCAEIHVETPRASVCLPFPYVELLLCAGCGNTGRRLRGASPRWEREEPVE